MRKLPALLALAIIGNAVSVSPALAYVNAHFLPYQGTSTISQDSTSRYTRQYMMWNGIGKQAFDSWNDTYEHETVFYNHDGTAYATGPLNSTAWSTSLPDPYLDTQALDGNKEYNIAVGTFDPDLITVGTNYTYFVRLKGTTSTRSFYKISAQKGYSGCELGAWCVESEQTAILIPFKSPFRAPEANRAFRYEAESNNAMGSATRINLSKWGSGVLDSTSDKDYFIFNIPSSRTVRFILRLPINPSSYDYDVYIYNSAGTQVASGVAGSGKDEVFSKSLSAGDYYAKIIPYSGSNSIDTYSFIAY